MKKSKPFSPRPSQKEILKYRSGYMGISAVPGSGKTQTLSALAAELIARGEISDEQEILIVTMTNSAVENFRSRIQSILAQKGLLTSFGYRIRTLHGLALDIVRERPDLANLSDQFAIIDEQEAVSIIDRIVTNYLTSNQEVQQLFSQTNFLEGDSIKVFDGWKNLLTRTIPSFIKQAKDLHFTPAILTNLISEHRINDPAFLMSTDMYSQYQDMLAYQNAVDFDDLIRLCDIVLDSDPLYLERLRKLWPYVLEDEAQDSSRLQEVVLRKIIGPNGNWVRVGDPNQAIYESFTTANPNFLVDFLNEPSTQAHELPISGRSSPSIIDLANYLITWTNSSSNPNPELIGALKEPYIVPSQPGDPQPNPEDHPELLHVSNASLESHAEINLVVNSLVKWYAQNTSETVAVLTPDNIKGAEIAERLRKKNVEVVEFLRANKDERDITSVIAYVFTHLADPVHTHKISNLYKACVPYLFSSTSQDDQHNQIAETLSRNYTIESLLYPYAQPTSNVVPAVDHEPHIFSACLHQFIERVIQWHSAVILPPDQFILSQFSDFCRTNGEIDFVNKLSRYIKRYTKSHINWNFSDIAAELEAISTARVSLSRNGGDNSTFDPDEHRGKVVVTTMHKAKGLEWDRVYLLSLNNYDFPFALPGDWFKSEPPILKDSLNFEAELTAKLIHLHNNEIERIYHLGEATRKARIQYAAERIRLFYVGITRAKKALSMTWNTGKRQNMTMSESLKAVNEYLKSKRNN